VLSDAEKRTVYDVYGEEGLRAGLELSTDVRDVRSAWERLKAKQVPYPFNRIFRPAPPGAAQAARSAGAAGQQCAYSSAGWLWPLLLRRGGPARRRGAAPPPRPGRAASCRAPRMGRQAAPAQGPASCSLRAELCSLSEASVMPVAAIVWVERGAAPGVAGRLGAPARRARQPAPLRAAAAGRARPQAGRAGACGHSAARPA